MNIDQFAIVRCRDAGVHCGVVKSIVGRQVELHDARRIWNWKGANTLNEAANSGVGEESWISDPVPVIILLDACEVIPTTDQAAQNLRRSRWT